MKTFKDRIKEVFTISTFAKVIAVAIIIITTIAPSLFDPEHADWRKVLNNFILSTVIVVMAFISQNASAKARGYEQADYKKSKQDHENKYHTIQNRSLSFFHTLYVKDENEKNKLERVREIFSNYEVPIELYTCDEKDIKTAFEEHIINKEQLSVIRLCRQGRFDYNKYDVRDLTTSRIVKKYSNANKSQEMSITWSNLLGKLSWVLAFAIIWGMFAWDQQAAEQGFKNGQAWIDLVGRLFQFAGGLWAGETNGKTVCDDDIRLYNQYYNFNSKFIQDFDNGLWIPKKEVSENILDIIHRFQKQGVEEEEKVVKTEDAPTQEYEEIEMSEEEYQEMITKQNK